MNNQCRYGERGLSLVELMIAMTIGLILLAGVYQVFISSSLSYKYQEDISRLQENARMAMDQLAQDVRQAGSPRFSTNAGQTFAVASGGAAPVTTGASGGTDTIAVAYLNDAGIVEQVSYAVNGNLELTRQTQVGAALPSGFQPIVDGVENMQIAYGVDQNNDDSIDAYVATPGAGDNMVSVRIRLLMRTINEQPKADLDTRLYDVDGDAAGVQEVDPVDDRRMRQIFTTTITLRNRLR